MQHGFFFYAAVVGLVALEVAVSGHALNYPASYHSDRAALATVTGSPLRARNYPSYFLNNSTEPPCPTGTIAPLRWVRRQVPLGTATSAASSSQSSPMPMLPTPPSNINRRSRLLGFFNKAALARRNHVPLFPLQNSSMPVGPTGTGSSTAYTIASHGGSYPLPTPVAQIGDGQVQGRSVSDATPVVQVDDGQVQASASLIRPSQHPTAPPYPVPNSTHVASTAAGPSSLHIISSERPTTITLPVTSTISSTVVCPSADASSVSHVATLSGFSAAQSVASVAMSTLQVFASQIDDGQVQVQVPNSQPTASAPVSQIESQGAPLPPAETPAPPSAQEASPPPPSAQEASPPPSPAQEASPPPPPPPPAQEAPPPPPPAPEAPAAPPPQAPTDNYTPPSPSASSSSSGTNPDNATPTVQQGTVAEVPKTADAVAGLENKTKGSLFAFVVALAVAVLI